MSTSHSTVAGDEHAGAAASRPLEILFAAERDRGTHKIFDGRLAFALQTAPCPVRDPRAFGIKI